MNEPAEGADAKTPEPITDGRLLRGARSRRRIARHAADRASLDGLDGLSIGRLATELGVSKGNLQTLFGTKERIQVAAAEAAREAFFDAVIRPAASAPSGVARLRAMIEHWLDYAEAPLFPGGCFWAANLPAFDSRPGAIRDVLFGHHRAWLELIAEVLRDAVDKKEIEELDVELAAFQIDAMLTAANIQLRAGDAAAGDRARRAIEGLLSRSRHPR